MTVPSSIVFEVEVDAPAVELVDLYATEVEVDTAAPIVEAGDMDPPVIFAATPGPPGSPGPGSPFLIVTAAQYAALSPPDPGTLYVVT